ncbi:MAG: 30S ribosomal protein S12 methylthiotransferase RimO [Nitrospirae bacterium]|nr:30S ribosomal protein S12 methylthiotransferase RimO [Nitrospirota bacterium]
MTSGLKKVGMINLGCPKNQVDAETMLGKLRAHGYELTADATEAEVIIVNTCGFIDQAKQESIDTILEMAQLKTDGKCQKLIATGCLTQRYGRDLAEGIPELDAVVGTGAEGDIAATVAAVVGAPGQLIQIGAPGGALGFGGAGEGADRVRVGLPHSAYVKIAEGCSKQCAFCIIPQLRGGLASRAVEDIVAEVAGLAAQGVVEVNLISQDTTNYGVDRYHKKMLAELVRAVAAVDGIRWVRLLYTYPTDYTDDLLDALAATPKVVPYIDLPLQHAATSVLKRMNRRGTTEALVELVDRIRQKIPGVALRSSFIVGFPGETEAEFDLLYDFVDRVGFDSLGVFTYSHEEGTAAYQLDDDVPEDVKEARKAALMELQAEVCAERNGERVGRTVEVLVDGLSAETDLLLEGRMATQAPEIDGVVYINDTGDRELHPGEIVRVTITEAHTYDLVGHLEGVAAP